MKYIKILFLNLLIIGISIVLTWLSMEIDFVLQFGNYSSNISITLGFLILLMGLYFRIKSSLYFYSRNLSILNLKPQDILITDGIYSISRNPLYIGIILIFLGIVLLYGSMTGIFLWIISFLFCDWWVRKKEEKRMQIKFKNTFEVYKKRTPRWI
ncbi:hypothetical protein KC866_02620 [Patescibacteria group bacterium]|nr:hypothetical protein [Patescibacteria group bacterium]